MGAIGKLTMPFNPARLLDDGRGYDDGFAMIAWNGACFSRLPRLCLHHVFRSQ
jgi:hypothetical protein